MFKPILENNKLDLIAEKNNKYIRIQIKTVQILRNTRGIPIRKIDHNLKKYKISYYTKEDIDYFIGVDLDTADIYILPVEFSSKYRSTISIKSCLEYKNNFSQLE